MAEYLSHLTHLAVSNRELKIYMIGGVKVESHLAFADDFIFFCRASVKSINKLSTILCDFSEFSSLEINNSKSFPIFSKQVEDALALVAILVFPVKSLPMHYLKVFIIGKAVAHEDFQLLIENLQ